MRRLLGFVTIVVVLAVLGACGGDEDEPVSAGGDERGSVEGEYVAIEVTEDGSPRALVDGATITLRLHDGQLSANAGCNTMGGAFTVVDGVLRVGELSITEMGCDPPRHEQDEWLVAFLSSGPRAEALDAGLVLTSDTVTITFEDESVARPDRDLVGTTWVVDGFVHGTGPDAAVSSAPGDAGLVVFDGNGFVTGDDGCNGFGYGGPDGAEPTDGLRYVVEGDRITFTGSALSTLVECVGVDTGPYQSVLTGTVTWEIDGNRLVLRTDRGEGVMYQARD